MPRRGLRSYLLLSKNGKANGRYSWMADHSMIRNPKPTILYRMKDFLANNILAWFVHTWWIQKRFDYPSGITGCIYDLRNSEEAKSPVTLCIAADWANATPQADYIGSVMAEKQADYTIHLGDTYYTGTKLELADNFGDGTAGNRFGIWPRGRQGSFALAGNHEMFSSGADFLTMIQNSSRGFGDFKNRDLNHQDAPFFWLRSEHWCILGLDTGYDSLDQKLFQRIFNRHPDNLKLGLPGTQLHWLAEQVNISQEKRGLIILSHHQYATAFNGENEFPNPALELQRLLPVGREVIWIWGHEHRFSIYGRYQLSPAHITSHGRCIGNGAMPDEHGPDRTVDPEKGISRNLYCYDNRTADQFGFGNGKSVDTGYNGYAHLSIDKEKLQITYYAAYWNGDDQIQKKDEAIIRETWVSDLTTGKINCLGVEDLTNQNNGGKSALNYFPAGQPANDIQ